MSVLQKNRRKIKYNGPDYLWYVKPDEDYCDKLILSIASNDKKLVLAYPIGAEKAYVVSKGKTFQGEKSDGNWHRYLIPFETTEMITPKFVSKLISFAIEESNAIEILYDGKEVWY